MKWFNGHVSAYVGCKNDPKTSMPSSQVIRREAGGIPFAVTHSTNRDSAIRDGIEYRKAGGHFYTKDEFLTHMREAIAEGSKNANS